MWTYKWLKCSSLYGLNGPNTSHTYFPFLNICSHLCADAGEEFDIQIAGSLDKKNNHNSVKKCNREIREFHTRKPYGREIRLWP